MVPYGDFVTSRFYAAPPYDERCREFDGATRLYERAGMHIARQYDAYMKELRAGREWSTQAITM